MKSNLQIDIETSILKGLQELRPKLQDSPISFSLHKAERKGFYSGFCFAKNWDTDFDFLNEIEGMKLIVD